MTNSRTRSLTHVRAMQLLVAITAAASWWVAPVAAIAADPGSVAKPSITDTTDYRAACGPAKPGEAQCFVLTRTDIVNPAAGAVSPALGPSGGFGPSELQSAYNLPSSTAGAGMTVGIVDAYHLANAESTLATYRSQFGLPACTAASGCFLQVDENGGTSYPATNVGWDQEIALDIDMVSAVCPLCHIILVEASTTSLSDLGAAVDTAVALGANAVSNSYGSAGEFSGELSSDVHYNHPGVIITAATGDCAYLTQHCGASSIEYPSASPWVIAVGGTSLVSAANARGWTETAWAGAGSGCSLYEPKPYWQTDSGCSKRAQADISAVANPNTGVASYGPDNSGVNGWQIVGGTSASSPIVAAAYMLVGRPTPNSYPFRGLYTNPASLYDVTSGSNGSCGGSYLCTAIAGYDGPTGLGTPAGTTALAQDVIALGAGTSNSCALSADGKLACWGSNSANQSNAPAGNYVALSTSDDHSCAIDTAGALHCWGNNANNMATAQPGTYVAVSAGPNDTCAIDTTGALHCWGSNASGQTAAPGGNYSVVAVGAQHACAINLRGAVTCWGSSSNNKTSVPAGVYTTISAGANFTCGIRNGGGNSGGLICWGDPSNSETAGSGGVSPFGPWMDVAAGTNGACALDIEGNTSCWGDSSQGQNSPPTAVTSRVARGQFQGCAYGAAGVTCWGQNTSGQATPLFSATPLPQASYGNSYSADTSLTTTVVPAVSFTVVSGSLPPGITLSPAGHFSGTPTSLGTFNFTVQASDGIAPVATAAMSIQVLPGKPGPPTGVTALAGNAQALVSWTAPVVGNGTITGYTVSSSPAGFGCTTSGATSCLVNGLTNGHSYSFTVTATNLNGTGDPSAPSNTVTPDAVPDPPTNVAATRGNGSANVTWTAPVNNGGSSINLYTVTSSPGGLHCTNTVAGGCPVIGLTNGTSYTFTVIAANSVGASLPSDPSTAVTPANHPDAPTAVSGIGTDSQVLVSWTASAANGSSISGYAVTASDGVHGCTTTGTSCTVGGLNNRTAYTFTVIATNGVGPGPASAQSAPVTPLFGATYVALTPNRLVDSRPGSGQTGIGFRLSSVSPVGFQVTDRVPGDSSRNVPGNATAVTGNLTVVGQTALGYLALTPENPGGIPGTSTLNFPGGDIRANGVTVPLGSGGRLWVTYVATAGATTDVVFDVTGYFRM